MTVEDFIIWLERRELRGDLRLNIDEVLEQAKRIKDRYQEGFDDGYDRGAEDFGDAEGE